jgi:hypothetical protein
VSPIYNRPIREQLEHDRVIRQLQARYKRKHEVAINPGAERNQSVMVGDLESYPDLVLFSTDRSRSIEGTVEVETGESVHLLEARSEWEVFCKLPAPFHLYVPPQAIESAKRLCDEQQIPVSEIWTYHMALDQVRFTQVYRSPHVPKPSSVPAPRAAAKAKPEGKARIAAVAKPEGKVAATAPVGGVKPIARKITAVRSGIRAVNPVPKPTKVTTKPAKASLKAVAKAKPLKPAAKAATVKKRR